MNALLFAFCTVVWGTTWFAIVLQFEGTAPEVAVAVRFLASAFLGAGFCLLARVPLKLSLVGQAKVALLGFLTYAFSFLFAYWASGILVSGFVAVGFASMPLFNLVNNLLFRRVRPELHVAAGGMVGLAGIFLVYSGELTRWDRIPDDLATGLVLLFFAVLFSSWGQVWVTKLRDDGISLPTMIIWGMLWGGLASLFTAFITGVPLDVRWTPVFTGSLLYLVVVGSLLGYMAFFRLVENIGPPRAALSAILSPALALILSAIFEGLQWRWYTVAGLLLVAGGNLFVYLYGRRLENARLARAGLIFREGT